MSHKDRVDLEKAKANLPNAVQGCPQCHGSGVVSKIHITCAVCTGRGTVPAYRLEITDQERANAAMLDKESANASNNNP